MRDDGAGKARGPKAVNRGTKRLLVYVLDVPATLSQNQIVIDLARRQRRPTGDWGPLKPWWHSSGSTQAKYDPDDRELLALLEEAQNPLGRPPRLRFDPRHWRRPPRSERHDTASRPDRHRRHQALRLRPERVGLVERLARSGRLRLKRTEGEDDPPTMRWDDGPAWRFSLDIRPELGGKRWSWRGSLRRAEPKPDRMDLAEPLVHRPRPASSSASAAPRGSTTSA